MKIYHIIIDDQVAYVGKTNNIANRTRDHKWLLKNNKHKNKYLQKQYNQHQSFDLVVVVENATDRDEQIQINKQSTNQRNNRAEPSIEELRKLHRRVFSQKSIKTA